MSEELNKLVEGVGRDELVSRLSSHRDLLREYSWESYEIGFNEAAHTCKTVSDLNVGLFEFNALLCATIKPRELYMINVEKLSTYQYVGQDELRKSSFVYIMHSMQLCLQSFTLDSSSTLLDGLGVILSATSCLIETISTDGHQVSRTSIDINGTDLLLSIQEVVEISLQFAYGLAARSPDWNSQEVGSASYPKSSSATSSWNSQEADDIAGFVLNLVSHFVTAISNETHRGNMMSVALRVLLLLRIDIRRLIAVPRSMRAFLYMCKAYHAKEFQRICKLEIPSDAADSRAESDAVAIAKGMKLGLCGSGLDDGSQKSHLSGLERVIFGNHKDEQRRLMVLYSRVCYDEKYEQRSGENGVFLDMGAVELVPWKAVNDSSVRSEIDSLRNILNKVSQGDSDRIMQRAVSRFLTGAMARRLPGGGEVEASSWPVLGCAMVVCHSFSLLADNASIGVLTPFYSYPLGVFTSSFMYQDVEPLLYPLLNHPRIASCEGLQFLMVLGRMIPSPGSYANALVSGYTYIGSATGVDTNGYGVSGAAQSIPDPWEAHGQLRKRAFGVNAVVSYIGWCEKEKEFLASGLSHSYAQDIRCVGQLCAASTDSHYAIQAIVSAIVQSPVESRAQNAYVALQKRLALFEPRGLCVLLRRLIQECPYGNVSGLLVDVVKSCTQRSSRDGGQRGQWCLITRLSDRVYRHMDAVLDEFKLPLSDCAELFLQISKDPLPAFLSQIKERATSSEEERRGEGPGSLPDRAKLREITEECYFLASKGASPFWSPFWVSTLARSSLEMLVCSSSVKIENDLDAIAASSVLLQHTLQRIFASKKAVEDQLQSPQSTNIAVNEHLICLRSFLLYFDSSVEVPLSELSSCDLLLVLKNCKVKLFDPLLDLVEDAIVSLENIILRKEKSGGAPTVLLRLQVLSMNIKQIAELLDT